MLIKFKCQTTINIKVKLSFKCFKCLFKYPVFMPEIRLNNMV